MDTETLTGQSNRCGIWVVTVRVCEVKGSNPEGNPFFEDVTFKWDKAKHHVRLGLTASHKTKCPEWCFGLKVRNFEPDEELSTICQIQLNVCWKRCSDFNYNDPMAYVKVRHILLSIMTLRKLMMHCLIYAVNMGKPSDLKSTKPHVIGSWEKAILQRLTIYRSWMPL